jgi:uncharacterized protein (TIGR03435 family)
MKSFLLFMIGLLPVQAQERVEFEVASVKPIEDPKAVHTTGLNIYPGGRVVILAANLKGLIATAFHLSYWQISGGEAWVEKDAYDIEAKPPEKSCLKTLRHSYYGIEDDCLREMLQALLISRFQLKLRRETKTGTVYLLERSGKKLALLSRENPSDSESTRNLGELNFTDRRWFLFNTSMPQLAAFASNYVLHAPVVDRTELAGSFDYKQAVPLTGEFGTNDFSDSFPHMISEVGLALKRSTGSVETFVIDHAEKPSGN